MTVTQQIYCMALHPRGELFQLEDTDGLVQQLTELGLLGEAFTVAGETRYKLGERFYQLLSFMGCAPALRLEPDRPGDEKFCHFRFINDAQTVFRYLRPEVKARCPDCRKPGDSANDIRQSCFEGQQDWNCPHCQTAHRLSDINWKHEAGVGRFFLELIDVHPHEVVPTDKLLNDLNRMTGQDWEYFYAVM